MKPFDDDDLDGDLDDDLKRFLRESAEASGFKPITEAEKNRPDYQQIQAEILRLLDLLNDISVARCEANYAEAAKACEQLLRNDSLRERAREQISTGLSSPKKECLGRLFVLRQGLSEAFMLDYP